MAKMVMVFLIYVFVSSSHSCLLWGAPARNDVSVKGFRYVERLLPIDFARDLTNLQSAAQRNDEVQFIDSIERLFSYPLLRGRLNARTDFGATNHLIVHAELSDLDNKEVKQWLSRDQSVLYHRFSSLLRQFKDKLVSREFKMTAATLNQLATLLSLSFYVSPEDHLALLKVSESLVAANYGHIKDEAEFFRAFLSRLKERAFDEGNTAVRLPMACKTDIGQLSGSFWPLGQGERQLLFSDSKGTMKFFRIRQTPQRLNLSKIQPTGFSTSLYASDIILKPNRSVLMQDFDSAFHLFDLESFLKTRDENDIRLDMYSLPFQGKIMLFSDAKSGLLTINTGDIYATYHFWTQNLPKSSETEASLTISSDFRPLRFLVPGMKAPASHLQGEAITVVGNTVFMPDNDRLWLVPRELIESELPINTSDLSFIPWKDDDPLSLWSNADGSAALLLKSKNKELIILKPQAFAKRKGQIPNEDLAIIRLSENQFDPLVGIRLHVTPLHNHFLTTIYAISETTRDSFFLSTNTEKGIYTLEDYPSITMKSHTSASSTRRGNIFLHEFRGKEIWFLNESNLQNRGPIDLDHVGRLQTPDSISQNVVPMNDGLAFAFGLNGSTEGTSKETEICVVATPE